MGWGAVSRLGFLRGPEREFRESLLLPSVRGEATGELGEEKKENSDQQPASFKALEPGELKAFKNFH